MKFQIFILLVLISSCQAEDGFIQIVYSFTETSVVGDAQTEGWGSSIPGPLDETTDCGGTITQFNFNTLENEISSIPPHEQIKIEYNTYCQVSGTPVGNLFVDGTTVKTIFATTIDDGPIRNCDSSDLFMGESQTISEIVDHTSSTMFLTLLYFQNCVAWDIKISYKPLGQEPDPQECFDHLGTLLDGEGNIPMTNFVHPFIQDGEQRFKFTTMFLEPYVFNDECLNIEVWFSDTLLLEGDGEIDQWSFDSENQKIIWNVNFVDFFDKYSCEDGEIGSQLFWKCNFSVKVIFDGEIQLEYTSKIQVVVDTLLSDFLEVNIQNDVVEGICCENQLNVQTELQFCTDMNCDTFLDTPFIAARKKSFFVLHRIVNPEFQDFFLKFLEAKLGEFIPSIVKYDSSQPGKLILELQSSIAKNNMLLTVISQLHKSPVVHDMGGSGKGNRFLQEDRITQAQQKLQKNEYKVAGYEQISVNYGQSFNFAEQEENNAIQKQNQFSEQKKELQQNNTKGSNSMMKFAVVSLIISVWLICILIYICIKYKKQQKLKQSKYLDSKRTETEQELQQSQ